MGACSQCPHLNDCLKVRFCLDDINAQHVATHRNKFPRLMTRLLANLRGL